MLRNWLRTCLFIPRCLGCDTLLVRAEFQGGFCAACEPALLPWPLLHCQTCCALIPSGTHKLCGSCIVVPPPLSHVRAGFIYGGPVRCALLRWKGERSYGVGTRAWAHQAESIGSVPDPQVDLWMPIPPSPVLQKRRDFVPTLELARALKGNREEGPPISSGLQETHRTGKGRHQRRHYRVRTEVRGLRVQLIDDVRTTGKASTAAAQALLRAGAQEVSLWTLARTPQAHELAPFQPQDSGIDTGR